MKTNFLALLLLILMSCGGSTEQSSSTASVSPDWQKGYDSAKRYLKDSLKQVTLQKMEYRKKQRGLALGVTPPDDGHVHDGGYGIQFTNLKGRDYVIGTMAVVPDTDLPHVKVDALVPLIVEKGKIKEEHKYQGKVVHPHIDYETLTIPVYLDGEVVDSTVIAITKKFPK